MASIDRWRELHHPVLTYIAYIYIYINGFNFQYFSFRSGQVENIPPVPCVLSHRVAY